MAQHASDREDLLAEATGLSPRAEWEWQGVLVTVGLRRSGAVSIYFGGDLMYQLDADGRLRRALVDGCLYRTQGDTLARLTRVRSPNTTELQRYDLMPDETTAFIAQMQVRLHEFTAAVDSGAALAGRQVPDGSAAKEIVGVLKARQAVGQLAPAIAIRF